MAWRPCRIATHPSSTGASQRSEKIGKRSDSGKRTRHVEPLVLPNRRRNIDAGEIVGLIFHRESAALRVVVPGEPSLQKRRAAYVVIEGEGAPDPIPIQHDQGLAVDVVGDREGVVVGESPALTPPRRHLRSAGLPRAIRVERPKLTELHVVLCPEGRVHLAARRRRRFDQ